jgi:Flp pilus assembly protein TadG
MIDTRRDRRSEAGISAVEVAIVLPVLFIFTFVIVHIGLMFHAVNVASDVADEALARAQREGASFADVRAQAESLGKGEGLFNASVIVQTVGTNRVRVTVTGNSSAAAPGLPTAIKRVVEGDIEAFIPERDRN